MKKYLSLALSLMMVICLIGCSNNNTSSTENKDNAIKNQSLKIGESYYDVQDRGDGIWDVYYSVEVSHI